MSEYPERIWLLPNSGDEGSTTWCNDPDPTGHGDFPDAVGYVRVDHAARLCDEICDRVANKQAQAAARLCAKAIRALAAKEDGDV